jgi:hypothetical protein
MTSRARERTRPRARLAVLLALALAPGSGACSFYKVRPPPPASDWPNPVVPSSSQERCVESLGPPIVDTIIGATFGTIAFLERNAVTFVPAFNADGTPKLEGPPGRQVQVDEAVPDSLSRGIAVGFGIAAIPYLASAIYGYIETSRCRRYDSLFR